MNLENLSSVITVNSGGSSGLIIPELALNAVWAFKIERFVKCQRREEETSLYTVTEDDYPYVEAVQESRWGNENLKRAEIYSRK